VPLTQPYCEAGAARQLANALQQERRHRVARHVLLLRLSQRRTDGSLHTRPDGLVLRGDGHSENDAPQAVAVQVAFEKAKA
jgi:hypothetical protein